MRSMTGFGRGKYEVEERIYEIEMKSVNHKYIDISIKMPRIFNFMEDKIRKTISEKIYRGKIDVYINFKNNYRPLDLVFTPDIAINALTKNLNNFNMLAGTTAYQNLQKYSYTE